MKSSGRTFLLALLIAALGVGLFAPTASAAKAKPPTVKSLLGKQFKSVSMKGVPKILRQRTIGLRFFRHATNPAQPKRATMAITGGCNALGVRYRVNGGRLASRGRFTGTAMLCKPNPDPWLTRSFRKGFKARVIGKRLVLSRPAKRVKLVFRQVAKSKPAPDKREPAYPIPAGEPASVDSLEGRSFKSVKVIGEQVKKPIEVSFDKGNLGAYLGCNRMSGKYTIYDGNFGWMSDGRLRWQNVITTDMACQDSKDRWFADLLEEGVEATVKDSWLVLARGKTTIILELVAEKEPPARVPPGEPATVQSLDGRSFESVSVIGKKLIEPIEISFWTGKVNRVDDEGKQVVGNGLGAYLGCNRMGGEYEIKDGQLRWFDVVQTLRGCFNGGIDRDKWFHDLVNQGVEVTESEAGLIFDSGPTQIVFKET